jgi:hypothetical protein
MEKKLNKLTLHQETLRNLSPILPEGIAFASRISCQPTVCFLACYTDQGLPCLMPAGD